MHAHFTRPQGSRARGSSVNARISQGRWVPELAAQAFSHAFRRAAGYPRSRPQRFHAHSARPLDSRARGPNVCMCLSEGRWVPELAAPALPRVFPRPSGSPSSRPQRFRTHFKRPLGSRVRGPCVFKRISQGRWVPELAALAFSHAFHEAAGCPYSRLSQGGWGPELAAPTFHKAAEFPSSRPWRFHAHLTWQLGS